MSEKTVTMYRVENPNKTSSRNDSTSREDLVGNWFTPFLPVAMQYLDKNMKGFEQVDSSVRRVSTPGSQLVVAEVLESKMDSLLALNDPRTEGMDIENHNYLLDRDGTIPMEVFPLDEIGEKRYGSSSRMRAARLSDVVEMIEVSAPE